MTRYISFALVVVVFVLPEIFVQVARAQAFETVELPYAIVYVQCPRTEGFDVSAEVRVGGERVTRTRSFNVADSPDRLPEVTRFFGGFQARCDLILRHPDGSEETLFECAESPDDDACSAMDPAVSFDGRQIAFSVFRGRARRSVQNVDATFFDPAAASESIPVTWPNTHLGARGAHLLVYDLESRTTREVTTYQAGIWDSGPAWLSTGRLAFTSTRNNVYQTLTHGESGRASQLHTVDPDGENIEVASHHGLAAEQHPYQLRDGRVAYSAWQVFGMLPFRKNNGSIRAAGSTDNLFHLYVQSPDGAEPFALYGQHTGSGPQMSHNAAHFLTQSGDGWVWTGEYYRANNNGLANILGFEPPPEGQEGYGYHELEALPVPYWERARYLYHPRNSMIVAPWSSPGNDLPAPAAEPAFMHPNYDDPIRRVGKIGFPAAVPEGLLLSWGLGACHIRTLARDAIPSASGGTDNPSCDVGIYRATSLPVGSPHDLERVVDRREFHEFMVRPVIPYRELFGVEQPDIIERAEVRYRNTPGLPPGTPFGMLGAASLIHRETAHHSIGSEGVRETRFSFQSHTQLAQRGGDLIDYEDDEICGVRILGVMPNDDEVEEEGNGSRLGERVVVLGEVPARHRDEAGAPILDAMGNPDTSFLLRMPANMPYLMQSVDCDGRALATDQVWQSVRPGERKTCGGCHVHSQESMPFEGTVADSIDFPVAELGEGVVPLMDGLDADGDPIVREVPGQGLAVELRRDVMPILERRCARCHSESDPAGDLRLDDASAVARCVFGDPSQTCVPEARRVAGPRDNRLNWPNYSRYARFMNARGSLLYWKAVNARTDGITDELRDSDIDFGADHPTDITSEELDTLAMWIELGGPAGERYLVDSQPPTLNVFGEVSDEGAVTGFRIGTTDLGSGVDPDSLELCELAGDECAGTWTPTADPHGVVEFPLPAPVSDQTTRFQFTVRDQAGNQRRMVRNVRWFVQLSQAWGLSETPPPLPGVDAGPNDGGVGVVDASGPTSPGPTAGMGCSCRVAPSPSSMWSATWMGLGALVWLRRRRRFGVGAARD